MAGRDVRAAPHPRAGASALHGRCLPHPSAAARPPRGLNLTAARGRSRGGRRALRRGPGATSQARHSGVSGRVGPQLELRPPAGGCSCHCSLNPGRQQPAAISQQPSASSQQPAASSQQQTPTPPPRLTVSWLATRPRLSSSGPKKRAAVRMMPGSARSAAAGNSAAPRCSGAIARSSARNCTSAWGRGGGWEGDQCFREAPGTARARDGPARCEPTSLPVTPPPPNLRPRLARDGCDVLVPVSDDREGRGPGGVQQPLGIARALHGLTQQVEDLGRGRGGVERR
jgi:hypothetical protein